MTCKTIMYSNDNILLLLFIIIIIIIIIILIMEYVYVIHFTVLYTRTQLHKKFFH